MIAITSDRSYFLFFIFLIRWADERRVGSLSLLIHQGGAEGRMVPLVISSGGDFSSKSFESFAELSKISEMNPIQTYRLVEMGKWSGR